MKARGSPTSRQLYHRKKKLQYNTFGMKVSKTTDFTSLDYTTKPKKCQRSAYILRKWILETGRQYICDICRCEQYDLVEGKWQWNGATLDLEVDHIKPRRSNEDDRVENLRLLCPNCHAQTSTYSAKSKGM